MLRVIILSLYISLTIFSESLYALIWPSGLFLGKRQLSSNRNILSASSGIINPNSSSTAQNEDRGNYNDISKKNSIARIPTSAEDLKEIMNEEVYDDANSGKIGFLQRKGVDTAAASNNRYYKMVEKLAPNELLTKFSNSAPQNVQEAAKSTIMNILGSLPQYALDAALITTNTKLANLMFQMQITGYMFKNAVALYFIQIRSSIYKA